MAVPQEFLTARMRLSAPRLDDAPALFAFMGDAEVMRHTTRLASLCRMRHSEAMRGRRDGWASAAGRCGARAGWWALAG